MKSQLNFKTTAEIPVSKKLVDQIIGQDEAINIIKKAAKQHRNVLLIGEPGTGKSLTGQALAELLPKEELVDVLAHHNLIDENAPLIKTVPRGQGIEIVNKAKLQTAASLKNQNLIFFALVILAMLTPWWIRREYGDIIAAASLIGSMIFLASFVLFMNINRKVKTAAKVPKLLIDNSTKKKVPFLDGTGAHAGALLGDCLHDPLQSFSSLNSGYKIYDTGKGMINSIIQPLNLKTLLDPLFKKHQKDISGEKGYEAFFTTKDELKLLGTKGNGPEEVEVLSANRYPFKGSLIKIITEKGKEIIITPEHKVATKDIFGKIVYKEASRLTRFDRIVSLDLS